MEEKYRVIFEGKIAHGQDEKIVKKRLASIFKTDLINIDKMFKNETVIKKNIPLETCKKIKTTLSRAGAQCKIAPEKKVSLGINESKTNDEIRTSKRTKLSGEDSKKMNERKPYKVFIAFLIAFVGSILTESSGLVYCVVALSAFWVYFDATRNKIGKIPKEKRFTNMSAGSWAIVTLLIWLFAFPVYIFKHSKLLEKAKNHPKSISKGKRITVLSFLGFLTFFFLVGGFAQLSKEKESSMMESSTNADSHEKDNVQTNYQDNERDEMPEQKKVDNREEYAFYSREYDFRNTHWGMNREQVKASETLEVVEEDQNSITYKIHIFNKEFLLMYFFEDGKLKVAKYITRETMKEGNIKPLMLFYYELVRILDDKYGTRVFSTICINCEDKGSVWPDSEEGLIKIMKNELKVGTMWRDKTKNILFIVMGTSNGVNYLINYEEDYTLRDELLDAKKKEEAKKKAQKEAKNSL